MSELLKTIKEDLKKAMTNEVALRKEGDTGSSAFKDAIASKTVSRAIISMLPEIGKKADQTTDDDIVKLIKKYIATEKTRELYIQKFLTEKDVVDLSPSELNKLVNEKIQSLGNLLTSRKILIGQLYLPASASKEEITAWIKENIDFSKFKNKMQAMGPIMKQFKGEDGNFVKAILEEM